MCQPPSLGNTSVRYSLRWMSRRRQVSMIDAMAATFGPASALPRCNQCLRPSASGRHAAFAPVVVDLHQAVLRIERCFGLRFSKGLDGPPLLGLLPNGEWRRGWGGQRAGGFDGPGSRRLPDTAGRRPAPRGSGERSCGCLRWGGLSRPIQGAGPWAMIWWPLGPRGGGAGAVRWAWGMNGVGRWSGGGEVRVSLRRLLQGDVGWWLLVVCCR